MQGCNDEALDTDAWSYALARLPENILDTYIYLISTSLPDLFSHPNLTHAVKSTLRARGVFNLHRGKSLIVLRDLETDLLDFCANLCIHLVEVCLNVRSSLLCLVVYHSRLPSLPMSHPIHHSLHPPLLCHETTAGPQAAASD